MQTLHVALLARLSGSQYSYLIDPTDLPFCFYLKPDEFNPVLRVIKREASYITDARISGKLIDLLALFEGELDGDAAFFSKALVIEGSTAAVVALRNAVDGEDIDIIKDIASCVSPYDKILEKLLIIAVSNYQNLQNYINIMVNSMLIDLAKDVSNLQNKANEHEEQLDEFNILFKRLQKDGIRKKSNYDASADK